MSSWTHIPVAKLVEGEIEKLVRMAARLHRRVIGQNDAVAAVSNAVRRARARLQDPNRPLGSFLFLGPTGVGKTELARALAEFLFDDERAMVRIDMSKYQEKHAISRLVGAPPGSDPTGRGPPLPGAQLPARTTESNPSRLCAPSRSRAGRSSSCTGSPRSRSVTVNAGGGLPAVPRAPAFGACPRRKGEVRPTLEGPTNGSVPDSISVCVIGRGYEPSI